MVLPSSSHLTAERLADQEAPPPRRAPVPYLARRSTRARVGPLACEGPPSPAAAKATASATTLAACARRRRPSWAIGPARRIAVPVKVIGPPVPLARKAHEVVPVVPVAPATKAPLALRRRRPVMALQEDRVHLTERIGRRGQARPLQALKAVGAKLHEGEGLRGATLAPPIGGEERRPRGPMAFTERLRPITSSPLPASDPATPL